MSGIANKINTYRKIKLSFPLKDSEGKDIAELNLRRAKVSDIRRMNEIKGSDVDKEIYVIALLTGLVPEDFDEMDIADYAVVQAAFMDMQKGK